MRRGDWFAAKIAGFNSLAFSLVVASVTFVDARLTSHVAFGARHYAYGYPLSLLGGILVFGITLLVFARATSWRVKATSPTLILATAGAVSLPFFQPEFPHGGISIWVFGTSLISLFACFIHFMPLETDWLSSTAFATPAKMSRVKESAIFWRNATITVTVGYAIILIPWGVFIWYQSLHIVTNKGEAFMLSEFGAAGLLGSSLYVLFGIIFELFRKAHDAADLVLRLEGVETRAEKTSPSAPEEPAARPPSMNTRDLVFISYSRKDKVWLDRLQTMLKPLVRKGALSVWAATTMQPGDRWKEELQKALASAKVAVLLVSDNFLASDFIAREELTPLLAAAAEEGVRILWIYVSACLYDATPIGNYQAAHDLTHALDELPEAAWKRVLRDVAREIQRAAG